MEHPAIQTAVDLSELIVHVADTEVAPLAVVRALVEANIKPPERRGAFLDRTVIAEGRIVVVGVDPSKQRIGRFAREVAEQLIERLLTSIRAGSELPLLAEFTVDVERQTSIGRCIVIQR